MSLLFFGGGFGGGGGGLCRWVIFNVGSIYIYIYIYLAVTTVLCSLVGTRPYPTWLEPSRCGY